MRCLHRTKLDRNYRMETLHILEAVFCDPCKNRVRASFKSAGKKGYNAQITFTFLPFITRCFAIFFTTKLGQRCSRFSLLMSMGELSLQLLIVFQRDRSRPEKSPFVQALRNFPALALATYLDANQDGNLVKREFADGKMVYLAKILFDGFDSDGDGSLEAVEVSLASLLRPAFLKTVARELFQLVDVNQDGFISAEDNLEFSLVMNLERNPTIIYGLLSVLDSDMDDRVVVAEMEELMIRFHSFLRREEMDQQCSVSLPMLVESLRRLGVPSETLQNILANLTPFVVTLPR